MEPQEYNSWWFDYYTEKYESEIFELYNLAD
jgi:hypothetical protein